MIACTVHRPCLFVSVMHTRLKPTIDSVADVDMAILDWWFVAPLAIATSFGSIYDHYDHYARRLGHLCKHAQYTSRHLTKAFAQHPQLSPRSRLPCGSRSFVSIW